MSAIGSVRASIALVAASLLAALLVVGIALVTAPDAPPPTSTTNAHGGAQRAAPRYDADGRSSPGRQSIAPPSPRPADDGGLPAIVIGLGASTLLGAITSTAVTVRVVRRRVHNRRVRSYARYEIQLSAHDEAVPHDLVDAVEALIGIVREQDDRRWKDGQPHFVVELHYGPGASGMEWTMCLVCEPRVVKQLDHALAGAYPNVRVGYEFIAEPEPIDAMLPAPACIDRFRKKRLFIYPLGYDVDGEEEGATLIERIAMAQVAAAAPSTVRMTFTPTMHAVERLASGLLQHQENRAARQESAGLPEAGLRSEHRREELRAAQRTQHRSLCWFELLVASDDPTTCKDVGAALQTFRGQNRLHRRTLDVSPRRLRRRYLAAEPPLLPLVWFNWLAPPPSLLGLRTLMSSTEISQLIALPTARTSSIPVRRLMIPRIPAPPEVARATDSTAPAMPAVERDDDFDESAFEPRTAAGE